MAIRPILAVGCPVLRGKARRVGQVDASIQRLVDDMIETMRAAPGVGLAAPQVGVPLRVVVIEVEDEVLTLINPEIVKREGECEPDEGCLSVPGFWGRPRRAERVTIKARDRNGREFRRTADGLLGQAFQHEVDHLDGTLYIDLLPSLDDLKRTEPPRKRDVDLAAARHAERAAARAAAAEPEPSVADASRG